MCVCVCVMKVKVGVFNKRSACRLFRYCTQILDKDIDTCCTSLLHELVRFQDRMYHKDPTKVGLYF